jgi:hypothetical protein
MAVKKLLWLPMGAAAILCATCAPVEPRDAPEVTEAKTTKPEGPPPEPVTIMPKPAPTGPQYRIESAIQNVRDRDLRTTTGFWTVFHGILGLGPSLTLRDVDTGKKVNALKWITDGKDLNGIDIRPTKYGLDVNFGQFPGFVQGASQGHQDQFIAEVGPEWGMTADHQFTVAGKDYTMMDFANHAQMRASLTKNQELSWTVIMVATYKGLDSQWTNMYGEELTLEDLVRYEVEASVENAACGGTHRLFGLTWVYHLHLQKGGKVEGVWKDVADRITKYRDLAKKYQNADGSLSTNWFKGTGDAVDKDARISTTGHTLEWLALALTDREIKQPWVENAANAVALTILDLQDQAIDGGALYHAVHGLQMYYARVYGRTSVISPELHIVLPPQQTASAKP